MKTLQEIIAEAVANPRSEDEQAFIDKHIVDKKDHPEAEESQFTSKAKKAKRVADREKEEEEEVYESRFVSFSSFFKLDSEELTEAMKAGMLKLHDGTQVKVDKKDAAAIESLMKTMSSSNKRKMEERMMKSKKGFDEIVKFAKEAM